MIRISAIVCIFIALAFAPDHRSLQAQTLTQSLLDEGAASLAREAGEKGDAVRGAILFSQKNLQCTSCHQPGATDLLGPDLSRLHADLSNLQPVQKREHLIDAILSPSKVIKKEFGSEKFLTDDGVLIVGRVLSENDLEWKIRDTAGSRKVIVISKASVEQRSTNDVSTMPAGLADQLASRQEFLDLAKYLIELADTPQQSVAGTDRLGGGEVNDRLKGLALIDHYRCVLCHQGSTGNRVPPATAPALAGIGNRVSPDFLERYVTDPHRVKPGTSMPDSLGRLEAGERERVAGSIVAYLNSLSDSEFESLAIDEASAGRGREVFHSVGCVACHSPRDGESGVETLAESSVALGDVSRKYNVKTLAAFLENPHDTRPRGRMPNMRLTHWEAVEIANFLLSPSGNAKGESTNGPKKPTDDAVSAGKAAFSKLGCANCHEPDADQERSVPLTELRVAQGCLSDTPDRSFRFDFKPSEKESIRTALQSIRKPLTDEGQLQLAMQTLRCYSCHQRGDLGGVTAERDLYFHSENENLGPQGRIPPTLTLVGAKLKPKWMRQVLVSGRAIRPYVKTRMPQYGTENVASLVELFGRVDEMAETPEITFPDPKETKKVGTELVGRGGLNCVACHTFQQKPAQTMPAVDLTEMAERLQRPWFEAYMRAPQSLSPGTVMPSFWPGGKAIRKEILDGNTDMQIGAVWQYLQDGRQARTPRGLDIKPIELVASDEAVMLRRSYQGIGKRGIGVGFPGEFNLAFDAEQLRLAMIWKGKFADPGGVWRGQGFGSVRPLSREVIRFKAGPDLDEVDSPWVVDDGRPPRHRFRGYFLDERQRPTFQYQFGDVSVDDYSIGTESGLKRTVHFQTEKQSEPLLFRVADGKTIDAVAEGVFRIDEKLLVKVDDVTAKVVRDGDSARLVVPMTLDVGRNQLVIHYLW